MSRKQENYGGKKFAERLNKRMAELGLNQSSLANNTEIQRQTISLYMTGKNIPAADKLVRLAIELHCSTDWLLGLSEYKNQSTEQTTAAELRLSEEVTHLLLEKQRQLPGDLNALLLNPDFRELIDNIQNYAAALKAEKIVASVREECEDRGDYDLEEMEPIIRAEIESAKNAHSGRVAVFLEALMERYSRYEDASVFNSSDLGEIFIQGLHLHEFYELAVNKTLVHLLDHFRGENISV